MHKLLDFFFFGAGRAHSLRYFYLIIPIYAFENSKQFYKNKKIKDIENLLEIWIPLRTFFKLKRHYWINKKEWGNFSTFSLKNEKIIY